MESEAATSLPTRRTLQYELRIGVTGHRDIEHPQDVTEAVRSLLGRIVTVLEGASADPLGPCGSPQSFTNRVDRLLARALGAGTHLGGPLLDALGRVMSAPFRGAFGTPRWPRVPVSPARPGPERHTPLKLTVISSLAKGADQLVARAVCELVHRPEERNRYLEAVLPFPLSIYEQDFTSPEDLEALRDLLKLDCGRLNTHPAPTVLFADFPSGPTQGASVQQVTRAEAYAAAGRYVVETSEIIIAIWDPTREQRRGGTGETVQFAIDRGRTVLWINPADLAGGSQLLRRLEPLTAGEAKDQSTPQHPDGLLQVAAGVVAVPLPTRAKELSTNFHRLAAYNRDGAIQETLLEREVRKKGEDLTRTAKACGLAPAVIDVIVGSLLPHVARADHLALRYRELRDFSARLWPTTTAIVVSLMAGQIIFLPSYYWLAWVELAVLLIGYIAYRVSVHDAWHDKWLNDRRLAEGLRAALFVTLVLPDREAAFAKARTLPLARQFGRIQDPLPFYSPANAWFVATLKRVLAKERRAFASSLDVTNAAQRQAVAAFLRDAWILAQAKYHERQAGAKHRVVSWTQRLRLTMIGALALVASLHALGVGHGHEAGAALTRLDLWVAWATVALPAWAAAFHVMFSIDDHERLAERSALMASLLRGLADQMTDTESLEQLRDCVSEAERILDLESAEWAESLADRRPEFTG